MENDKVKYFSKNNYRPENFLNIVVPSVKYWNLEWETSFIPQNDRYKLRKHDC